MEKAILATIFGFLTVGAPGADSFAYRVRHDHLFGSCSGTLAFEDAQLRFDSSEDHSLVLPYLEVQQLRLSRDRIDLLTWEDRPLLFGKDRILHFELLEGEIAPAVIGFLEQRLSRPLVTSVIPELQPRHILPVKHQGFFRGTQGNLELGDEGIVFRSADQDKSRFWRWEEVSGYGSTGPYQLRISVMERTGGQAGELRNFVFSLKQPLSSPVLELFWAKVHGPRIGPPDPGGKGGLGG